MTQQDDKSRDLYMEADTVVCEVPCELNSIVVANDGVGNGVSVLRDGQTASDDIKIPAYTLKGQSFTFVPPKPIKFNKGLFFDIGANVVSAAINYTIMEK